MTSHEWRTRALSMALVCALTPIALSAQTPLTVASPDGKTQVTVALDGGVLRYTVRHDGANVVTPSRLGFAFKGAAPLGGPARFWRPTDSSRRGWSD